MTESKNKNNRRKFKKVVLAGEEKINTELEAIYRNGDGSLPNMVNFDDKPKRSLTRPLIVLFLACLFLLSALGIIFFVFNPSSQFSENDVILEIAANKEITAGDLDRKSVV